MRIAMMTNNYKPFVGGVPISIERLSEGLRRRGHEAVIFAPEYEGVTCESDVVRYRACEKKMKNGMIIPDVWDPRVRDEFLRRNFDVIHVHQPMLIGSVALHLSRKYRTPLVFTYHTRYEEYLHYLKCFEKEGKFCEAVKKTLPRYLVSYAGKCDLVYAPSYDMKRYLDNMETGAQVRVLPTGLSPGAYEKDEKAAAGIRKKYAEGRPYLFCTVSRLEKEKNLYFLLDSVKRLKERMGDVFRFMIAGDGAEAAELSKYTKELGVEDVVRFTGFVENENVKNYMAASDAFLFASKSETQGIVLAEAFAAGIPVVALKACGVCDIVKNDENGCMTAEKPDEFAKQVQRVAEDKELREKLRKGAKETAEKYRAEAVARRAEEGYEFVMKRRESMYGYETFEKKHRMPSVLRLFKVS